MIFGAQADESQWFAGGQLREAGGSALGPGSTENQATPGTVPLAKGDSDRLRGPAGYYSNCALHVGSDEPVTIFVAVVPNPVESCVVVAEVVVVVLDVAFVVCVVVLSGAEVPVAAAANVVSAPPAAAAFVAAAVGASSASASAAVAPAIGNLPAYCNSDSARSDCPELPYSNRLPSSAWAVQKLTEKVAKQNYQLRIGCAVVDLTFQAFVSVEKFAVAPSPCYVQF